MHAQRQGGVVDRRQPGQQQVPLGHQHRWGARDRAAVGLLQPADQLEQRRLAAAAGADHRDDLAGPGPQRHAFERHELALARGEAPDHVFDPD
jgi:hypothetical protein